MSTNKHVNDVLQNLRKIMADRNITQATLAEYAGTDASQFSRLMNGSLELRVSHLANIAINLGMDIIDLFTYPHKYVKPATSDDKASLPKMLMQIELDDLQKLEAIKLLFGENHLRYIEIAGTKTGQLSKNDDRK